jgi:hypothetical protein
LVLLPIQFFFNSPQRNAELKSSFEQFSAVHLDTRPFAENHFASDTPLGGKKPRSKSNPFAVGQPLRQRIMAEAKNEKSRRGGTPSGVRPRRLTR